jgi:type IV secretion system protein VirB9
MKKNHLTVLMCAFALSLTSVYAQSVPRGVATDPHVKVVMYDPNNVVLLKGKYGYQTQITFAPNETVQTVSVGDSLAWQVVPASNHLFIKPLAASNTNMTVLTTQNSYSFQLDSNDRNVIPTYKLLFTYPNNEGFPASTTSASFDPAMLNWKYSFTGDKDIAPIEAFDNGTFTYLKFKESGMNHLPAIFMVNKDRKESLVNFHMQGNYLVVNGIAKQFTLRHGDYVTSVYNDAAINH